MNMATSSDISEDHISQLTFTDDAPRVMEDSSREKRFQQDKEQLLSCCSSYKFVTVKTLGETSLSLEFVSGEKRVEYSILYTPDYPDNTVVTNTQDQADVKCYTKPLVDIFIDICKEWCKIHEISMTSEQTDTTLTDSNTILTPPHSVADNTHQLLTSQMSEASSIASSEMTEESDYEDYFDDYEDVVEEDIVSPLLEKDIEIMERLYGKSSVESRIFAGINEIDILMYIDMGFLDVHTASAWGVNVEVPVVLQVHFHSARKYLDGPEPKIEVYQGSPNSKEKRKFGLGAQIQKIVETFVSNQWKSTSNYHLEQCSERISEAVTHETATTPTNTPPSTSQGHPRSLQMLVDMGFPLLSAEQALEMCGQEVQKAVHLLTTGELLDDNEVKEIHNFFTKKTKLKDSPQGSPPVKLRRQDSQGARAGLVLDNSIEHVKQPPSLENGYLAQVMKYALNRIPSLSEFCVICDERHVLETGLLRPCVCTRELCVFAFQTLGVMADAAESVAADANVVDLMIAMCNAAATSSRSSIILDPYPSIVDPANPHRLAMDPAHKNYEQVVTIMKAIIAGREELLRGRCTHQSLKAVLDGHHRLAFPLMQWIVATNRAYIVMIPEDRQLSSMGTKYQFLLISSPPAKEAAFQAAKKKHGSTFAFHGSSIENWHSIMRKGLINASGTKFQLHGAAYGNGIYLSPNAGTSFGYSNRSYYCGTPKGAKPKERETLAGKVCLICIALCEVVTSKELRKNGDIWVCSVADHVVTRFFFVYDEIGQSRAHTIHTQNKDFKQEITHAINLAQQLKRK